LGRKLTYEMRTVRSINRLHVGKLGPSGIGGTPLKFLVDVNTKTENMYIYKKKINYYVFLLT
jgi:hypothetical protein